MPLGRTSTPQGLTLAIETSQREAAVALRDRAGVVHEEQLSQRKRHDDDLMPAIDRLFKRVGLTPGDLRGGAVAVSIGPGGFTGLRIAIATAKMFSEALGVKLVAVPSALVAAEEAIGQQTAVSDQRAMLVALACKGESFWATRVRRGAGRATASVGWEVTGDPGIVQAAAFDLTGLDTVIADEFFPDSARQRVAGAGIAIIPLVLSATSVLAVGTRMLMRGETVDPLRLMPLYPREPEAVTLWNAREAKK
jgi:tRNA threonylcarbamoyladenosine biosynthesis protein TsaB